MDAAFGWLGAIVDWFGKFFPRWHVVDTRHAYIKWVRGHTVLTGGAGIVWWWPPTTKIIVWAVARQSFDLRAQTLTTKDGVTCMVGGLITYRIVNIAKAVGETWDTDETIRDSALTAIHDVVSDMTWEELRDAEKGRQLKTKLRNEARKVLDDLGVEVIKLSLTDFARTRVLKVAMSTDTTNGAADASDV